jgi:8-oxo-dGTP pyrophosphatase MutT (NUDIX family)
MLHGPRHVASNIADLAFLPEARSLRGMHRQPLLAQLSVYQATHTDEADTVQSFIEFVLSQPECFERTLAIGHITGSAWIVTPDGSEVLLTHHRKLDRWLQLGGHADGDPDVIAVALKEAREESGLEEFELLGEGIFDLDIHPIPARKNEPEHLHYDVRYVFRAIGQTDFTVSEESHDLRWVPINEVQTLTTEESMLRMVRKWQSSRSI